MEKKELKTWEMDLIEKPEEVKNCLFGKLFRVALDEGKLVSWEIGFFMGHPCSFFTMRNGLKDRLTYTSGDWFVSVVTIHYARFLDLSIEQDNISKGIFLQIYKVDKEGYKMIGKTGRT